jgi:hypothetical protein
LPAFFDKIKKELEERRLFGDGVQIERWANGNEVLSIDRYRANQRTD